MSLLKACNGGSVVDPPVDLTEGLIAQHLLNNNTDESFGTHVGTPFGSVDFQGDMVALNGTDAYINSTVGVGVADTDLTISAWFNSNHATQIQQIVAFIEYDGTTVNKQFGIVLNHSNTGAGFIYFHTNDGTNLESIQVPYNTNELTHVAISRSNTIMTAYVNGVEVGSATLTGVAPPSANFNIGYLPVVGVAHGLFSGTISNVRVYSEYKDINFTTALFEEGYYPKPLPLPTTDGLLAHYPLTGTAEDATGNYDGTEVGNTYVNDAEFGSVASFDGVDNHITSIVQPIQAICSISSWLKRDNISTNYVIQQSSDLNLTSRGLYISSTGQVIINLRSSTGSWQEYVTSSFLSSTVYQHIVVEFNGASVKVYSNNTLVDSHTFASYYTSFNSLFVLGATATASPTTFFKGYIKDVRIYNRELTLEEITDIYNYEKNFRPIDIDEGLVAYYPLANNSLDNYYNEYDGVDTNVTYDGDNSLFNDGFSQLGTLPINMNNMSFSIWINTTGTDEGGHSFFNDMEGFGVGTDRVWFALREATYYFDNGSSTTGRVSGATLPEWLNTFVHVVYTKTSTHVNLYINNILVQSVANTVASTYTSMSFGKFTASADGFTGKLKYGRIYDKAITAEQVEVIYNTEKGDFI